MVKHKPYRQEGDAPYLHLNKRLQEIVDSRQNILFLPDHTHVSLNCSMGCVERDGNGNLYINAGAIHPTALKPDETLQPSSWTEGNVLRLELGPGGITVTGLSLRTGKKISRGYYFLLYSHESGIRSLLEYTGILPCKKGKSML